MSNSETLVPGAKFGRFAQVLRIAQIIAVILILAGAWKLRTAFVTPASMVAFTHDNRALTGTLSAYHLTDERVETAITDIVESALSRTEKGLTPELRDYVTDSCAPKLQLQLSRSTPRDSTFTQTFEIDPTDGIRIIDGNAITARAYVRGITTTRSASAINRGRFYWAVGLMSAPIDSKNATGWKLNDIFEVTEKDFYETDIANAAAEAVKPSSKPRK